MKSGPLGEGHGGTQAGAAVALSYCLALGRCLGNPNHVP